MVKRCFDDSKVTIETEKSAVEILLPTDLPFTKFKKELISGSQHSTEKELETLSYLSICLEIS